MSDVENAKKLFDRKKGVKASAVYKEIAQFINDNASTNWDEAKVKGQVQQLRNPSFFALKNVMTNNWNAQRKVFHVRSVVSAVGGGGDDGSMACPSSNGSNSTQPSSMESTPSPLADDPSVSPRDTIQWHASKRRRGELGSKNISNLLEKIVTSTPAGESKILDILDKCQDDLRSVLDDMRVQLKEMRKELLQTTKELRETTKELQETRLQYTKEKLAWMQEKLQMQLLLQKAAQGSTTK
ncbi:hypothetical protein BGZ73_008707 [Actinomortierella ambigua]|nr:hypothetical protein BGZ73_008707 [Actinomortierella ambigua]